jgi:transposase
LPALGARRARLRRQNALTHHVTSSSIKGGAVVEFLEQIALQGDERPTVVVLDNASIHHAIDAEVHERWLREHPMQLFYLPPYSPELNLIEIVWKPAKCHWRHFVTWTKETIDDEVRSLRRIRYQISNQFHLNTYLVD